MSRKTWGRGQAKICQKSEVEERFNAVRQKIDASVTKHLKEIEDSSSEDELDVNASSILSNVLQKFNVIGGDLGRTKQYLENSFQSSAGVCLICIASIKKADAIWSCESCYGSFHINCIQKWAKDSLFHLKKALDELPAFKRNLPIVWACPKCRHEYNESSIPKKYKCFCGKTLDPALNLWHVPHSCGETCDKDLQPKCGHRCLLLCHPGPCPPCPKSVKTTCYCGQSPPTQRRCCDKYWKCNKPCNKLLLCGKHKCESLCHDCDCPKCPKQSLQFCQCGNKQVLRPCSEPNWQCDKICGKAFSCGNHVCQLVCHKGECGDCPLAQERKCPCGKSTFILPCTQETLTCNDTCGKLMDCGVHYCAHKCHKDKCVCLEIVRKSCRCGQHQKELPCSKEFLCDTKCKLIKACQRHQCNRRCCDLTCPPCEKPCGRVLGCGNHRCESVCHSGPCYPCPQMSLVKCRCGSTQIHVPCGRKRKTKPPRCSQSCQIPPDCDHEKRNEHRCHFGECPPCKQICGKPRTTCSHFCRETCHVQVWCQVEDNYKPKGPWEVTGPQLKRITFPCPPCVEPVPVICAGQHETLFFPCHQAQPAVSCGRPCGQKLPCGNHACDLECHLLTPFAGDFQESSCVDCNEECMKSRPQGCSHACPLACHQGDCPPCENKMKVKCHCGLITLYMSCTDLTADEERKSQILSCGNTCPQNYPCGHRCRSICHPGDCPNPDSCRKKVKVACPCGRFKKDMTCDLVRKGETVQCNEVCQQMKDELKQAKENEAIKAKEEEERRQKEELEKFEKKMYGKKKTRERKRVQEVEIAPFFDIYKSIILAGIVSVCAALYITYFF